MVTLIDTHAHIYTDDFADLSEMMLAAEKANVVNILMPNIDEESIESMLNINKLYPKNTSLMMGLHPCSVKKEYQAQLLSINEILGKENIKAIGEIGLDYYWSEDLKKEQIVALEIQLQWAIDRKLPVSLHTRNATQDTIDLCKNFKGLRGVFHCFGGTISEAEQIINLEMHLGIGGIATFKNGGLLPVLENISLDNIVLETDAPYLAPTPYRGKRNEPAYLLIIAQHVADIMNEGLYQVAKATSKNAVNIFNLSKID